MAGLKRSAEKRNQTEVEKVKALKVLGASPKKARFIATMAQKEVKGDILKISDQEKVTEKVT